jgi:hypothetical protein
MSLHRALTLIALLVVAPASFAMMWLGRGDPQAFGVIGLGIAGAILCSCWSVRGKPRVRKARACPVQSRPIYTIRTYHLAH